MSRQTASTTAETVRNDDAVMRQLDKRHLIAALVAAAGLVVSVAIALSVREVRAVKIRGEFEELSESRFRAVQNSFDRNRVALASLQSLFTSFGQVTRKQFADFSQLLLTQVPGIQALEWIPRVPESERERYESVARSEGFDAFQFTVRDPARRMVRAPKGDVYYPVYYLEPLKGNEKALGFDLASDADRFAALRLARDTGKPVATRRIQLVQGTRESFGFLLFLPVYKGASQLGSVQDRRERLAGFALGVFWLDDIVEGALGQPAQSGIYFYLYDRTESNVSDILYSGVSDSYEESSGGDGGNNVPKVKLRNEETLDIGGRRWVMENIMTQQAFQEHLGLQHWFVLTTGFLLTGLLTAYFVMKIKGENALRGALSEVTRLQKQSDADRQVLQTLFDLTEQINSGLLLEDVLRHVYASFRRIVPYDRISLALLDQSDNVRTYWVCSDEKPKCIARGYSASLEGSSLQSIVETGKPRILNDLVKYLKAHPESESTRLIVEEGMRSSLTCPLIADGKPAGFMFFSSRTPNTYRNVHMDLFTQIASHLSATVQKSWMYEELLELNTFKNRFLGMAAHDMGSPLSIIKGYMDYLEKGVLGRLSDDEQVITKAMKRACDKMLVLINDLLDVSAIEAGKLQIDAKEVDLIEYLRMNYELNSALARMKDIELKLEVPPDLVGKTVYADPDRIDQVINNLITNAIKFSRRQTTIELGARDLSDQIEIYVSDNGQGICQEEVDSVFSEFQITSTRPTDGEKSTGLGLAIAKHIVESHGGHIRVVSEAGTGSTFSFSLPKKKT